MSRARDQPGGCVRLSERYYLTENSGYDFYSAHRSLVEEDAPVWWSWRGATRRRYRDANSMDLARPELAALLSPRVDPPVPRGPPPLTPPEDPLLDQIASPSAQALRPRSRRPVTNGLGSRGRIHTRSTLRFCRFREPLASRSFRGESLIPFGMRLAKRGEALNRVGDALCCARDEMSRQVPTSLNRASREHDFISTTA
jgi:hypothetical protein